MHEPPHRVRYSSQSPEAYLKVFAVIVGWEAEVWFCCAGMGPGAPPWAWAWSWSKQVSRCVCTSKEKKWWFQLNFAETIPRQFQSFPPLVVRTDILSDASRLNQPSKSWVSQIDWESRDLWGQETLQINEESGVCELLPSSSNLGVTKLDTGNPTGALEERNLLPPILGSA